MATPRTMHNAQCNCGRFITACHQVKRDKLFYVISREAPLKWKVTRQRETLQVGDAPKESCKVQSCNVVKVTFKLSGFRKKSTAKLSIKPFGIEKCSSNTQTGQNEIYKTTHQVKFFINFVKMMTGILMRRGSLEKCVCCYFLYDTMEKLIKFGFLICVILIIGCAKKVSIPTLWKITVDSNDSIYHEIYLDDEKMIYFNELFTDVYKIVTLSTLQNGLMIIY